MARKVHSKWKELVKTGSKWQKWIALVNMVQTKKRQDKNCSLRVRYEFNPFFTILGNFLQFWVIFTSSVFLLPFLTIFKAATHFYQLMRYFRARWFWTIFTTGAQFCSSNPFLRMRPIFFLLSPLYKCDIFTTLSYFYDCGQLLLILAFYDFESFVRVLRSFSYPNQFYECDPILSFSVGFFMIATHCYHFQRRDPFFTSLSVFSEFESFFAISIHLNPFLQLEWLIWAEIEKTVQRFKRITMGRYRTNCFKW